MRLLWLLIGVTLIIMVALTVRDTYKATTVLVTNNKPIAVINGVDTTTGLVIGDGFELVRTHCTGCHSARLVTQNKLNRVGWESAIRWMQQTQGLWALGQHEVKILDYLEKHYGPQQQAQRRQNLKLQDVVWYPIKE